MAAPGKTILWVDPCTLRLPSGPRRAGADPGKLARQLSQHGSSVAGLPPLFVIKGKNGELQILDGVTRATRVATLLPGQLVPVDVIQDLPNADFSTFPTVGDTIP